MPCVWPTAISAYYDIEWLVRRHFEGLSDECIHAGSGYTLAGGPIDKYSHPS